MNGWWIESPRPVLPVSTRRVCFVSRVLPSEMVVVSDTLMLYAESKRRDSVAASRFGVCLVRGFDLHV
jgi:hypothetical protein